MADTRLGKIGITVKEPWAADISFEVLDMTLNAVENGGDGCSYVALRDNIGVTPGTDPNTWVKSTQAGQSIYDLAVKYHHFVGTEEEFEAQYQAVLQAARDAAAGASAVEAQVEAAETARVAAETGRADAESARQSAEADRQSAESARGTAEAARQSAESGRASAETARVTAEQGRASAETERASAEAARAAAETDRVSDFSALKTDMETAIGQADAATAAAVATNNQIQTAEAGRVSAEQGRVSAETARASAESARATAESGRATAETARVTAEGQRATAEGQRVTAENARVSAESGRASAESARVTAEAARVSAETARESQASSDHTRAESDHAIVQGYDTRLTNVEGEVSQLGQRLGPASRFVRPRLYTANSLDVGDDYEASIKECFVVDLPAGNICLKMSRTGADYCYMYSVGSGVYARASLAGLENGDLLPIKVYSSSNPSYPSGKIVGYVIFCDIDLFKTHSIGTEGDIISREIATNKANSPVIQEYLIKQDIADINQDIADINQDIADINQDITDINQDIEDIDHNITDVENDIGAIDSALAPFKHTDTYTIANFVDGYTQTQNKDIGDTFTPRTSTTPVGSSSVAGQLVIPEKKGYVVTAKMKSTSNSYCMAYLLLDTEQKILSWAGKTDQTFNWLTTPQVFSIENDGYIVFQFTQADYNENLNAPLAITCEYYDIEIPEPPQPEQDNIEISLPDEIVAVVGDTLQLYYHSVYRCVDFRNYAVKVTCDIGAQYPRYFEITPIAGQVGNHSLTFAVKDNNNNLIGTKTTNLKVVAVGGNPASELNVLCLGASATQGGQWASEFKRRLIGTGGTPTGSGKTNIQFVGRKNVTFDGKQVNLEATGGYSFPSYTNTNTARYRFNVTAENEPTINVDDVYSNNGNDYTIKEINITPGEGGYFSCEGTGVPQSSGILTKVSGTGSETITYSSTSFSGNPFVYNGVINMQQYADDYCNPQGATHGRIDVIYTELFGNGTSVYMDDFTTRMSQMQTFINQVRSVFPNCKFCIGLFWNPDIRGGMGVSYGATGGWSDPYGIKYSNMNLCNALQKYITDNNLSDYVFILNWLNEFDTWNDMQQTTKKVNPRSDVTEIFGVNGVHPATDGYYQMSDTAWRLFVAKFCQSN